MAVEATGDPGGPPSSLIEDDHLQSILVNGSAHADLLREYIQKLDPLSLDDPDLGKKLKLRKYATALRVAATMAITLGQAARLLRGEDLDTEPLCQPHISEVEVTFGEERSVRMVREGLIYQRLHAHQRTLEPGSDTWNEIEKVLRFIRGNDKILEIEEEHDGK